MRSCAGTAALPCCSASARLALVVSLFPAVRAHDVPPAVSVSPWSFTTAGSAYVSGDTIVLTENQASQSSSAALRVMDGAVTQTRGRGGIGDGEVWSEFYVQFELYVGDGSGADGTCVNIGERGEPSDGEGGVDVGLSMCFVEWYAYSRGIRIRYNGADVWHITEQVWVDLFEDSQWHTIDLWVGRGPGLETLPDNRHIIYFGFDGWEMIGTARPFDFNALSSVDVNPDHALYMCEGDCDDDSDCRRGLTCFHRGRDGVGDLAAVPGCDLGYQGEARWDYCVPSLYGASNGNQLLELASFDLPSPTYLSFTARSGGATNNHWIRNVKITEPLCEAGQYLATDGRCLQCSPGKYQVAGYRPHTSCINCPAGQYGLSDRTSCGTCHRGTYTAGASSALLSEGRPTEQSSTSNGGVSSRAVDGRHDNGVWTTDWDGPQTSGTCTHTRAPGEQWWQVDLGQPSQIGDIEVYHRTDCCLDRAVGARVIVSSGSDFSAGAVCATLSEAGATPEKLNCGGLQGRYITVDLDADVALTLCEVKVWQSAATSSSDCIACPSASTSAPGSTSSSDCLSCSAGEFVQVQGSASVSCASCSMGQYQASSRHAQSSCIRCPAGKRDSLSRADCTICPAGRYQYLTASSDCIGCERGHTSMAGSSDVSACRKRNSTSIELTGQVTYDIDIASIPIGSAARASFENEFTIAVSIAMAVQSKDVVINNIAAVRGRFLCGPCLYQVQTDLFGWRQGSVIVDFSVWTESTTVATTFATAITPAALMLSSSGSSPIVAVNKWVPPSSEAEEEGDGINIISTRSTASIPFRVSFCCLIAMSDRHPVIACLIVLAVAGGGAAGILVAALLCTLKRNHNRKKRTAPDVTYRPSADLELQDQQPATQNTSTDTNVIPTQATTVAAADLRLPIAPGMVVEAEPLPEFSAARVVQQTHESHLDVQAAKQQEAMQGHQERATCANRDELQVKTVKELREYAATTGASTEDIDDARDAHDPHAALQKLIRSTESAQAEEAARKREAEDLATHEATAAAAARAKVEEERDNADKLRTQTVRTVKELREYAATIGASAEDIDDARDAHDPHAALQELIRSKQAAAEQLLQVKTVKQLREHAAVLGVDREAIEEARDSNDPRTSLILLIQQHGTTPPYMPPILKGP